MSLLSIELLLREEDRKAIMLTRKAFENIKIKVLRQYPDGEKFMLLWMTLLLVADENGIGDGGLLIEDGMPYTAKIIAVASNMPQESVEIGLDCLLNLNLIKIIDDMIYIVDWKQYQISNCIKKYIQPGSPFLLEQPQLTEIKKKRTPKAITSTQDQTPVLLEQKSDEQENSAEDKRKKDRLRQQRYRENKLKNSKNVTPSVTLVTPDVTLVTPSVTPDVTLVTPFAHYKEQTKTEKNKNIKIQKTNKEQTVTEHTDIDYSRVDVTLVTPDVTPPVTLVTPDVTPDVTPSIHQLLVGTPLENISDLDLANLEKKYGREKVVQAADLGAETWKKNKEEIRNPGGYLNSLCSSMKIPQWFVPYAERVAERVEQTAEPQQPIINAKIDQATFLEEEKNKAIENLWLAMPNDQQERYKKKAVEVLPMNSKTTTSPEVITLIAQGMAWEEVIENHQLNQ